MKVSMLLILILLVSIVKGNDPNKYNLSKYKVLPRELINNDDEVKELCQYLDQNRKKLSSFEYIGNAFENIFSVLVKQTNPKHKVILFIFMKELYILDKKIFKRLDKVSKMDHEGEFLIERTYIKNDIIYSSLSPKDTKYKYGMDFLISNLPFYSLKLKMEELKFEMYHSQSINEYLVYFNDKTNEYKAVFKGNYLSKTMIMNSMEQLAEHSWVDIPSLKSKLEKGYEPISVLHNELVYRMWVEENEHIIKDEFEKMNIKDHIQIDLNSQHNEMFVDAKNNIMLPFTFRSIPYVAYVNWPANYQVNLAMKGAKLIKPLIKILKLIK